MDALFNGLGFLGAALMLVAYFLLQTRRLSAEALYYSLLNLAGALLVIVSLLHAWNLSAFIIECAWALVSLIGLWKLWKKA